MKPRLFGLSLLFIFFLGLSEAFGQTFPTGTGCSDTLRRTKYCQCAGQDWRPVCGCDNVTYASPCFAENCGAVSNWHEGPCEPIAYKILRNPFTEYFEVNIALKETGYYRIALVDAFGKLIFQQNYPTIDRGIPIRLQFTKSLFPKPGMYFMLFFAGKGYAIAPLQHFAE